MKTSVAAFLLLIPSLVQAAVHPGKPDSSASGFKAAGEDGFSFQLQWRAPIDGPQAAAARLNRLSETRQPLLFTPYRPPPVTVVASVERPVVVAAPPKPDRPQLILAETVIGTEGITIFRDGLEKGMVRLRVSEDRPGWGVISIQGRTAMAKKREGTAEPNQPKTSKQTLSVGPSAGDLALTPTVADPTIQTHNIPDVGALTTKATSPDVKTVNIRGVGALSTVGLPR